MPDSKKLSLETALDRLMFDAENGRLVSLRSRNDPATELLEASTDAPSFALQYLTEDRRFETLDSRDAARFEFQLDEDTRGRRLALLYNRIGKWDLDVTLTIRCSLEDPCSRWSCAVRNRVGLRIIDVQFPYVIVPRRPDDALLMPAGHGALLSGDALDRLPVDDPNRWRLIPENGSSPHYPGNHFAQFLAWYGSQGGIYLACEDDRANVKLFRAVRRGSGIRLGIAHIGGWGADRAGDSKPLHEDVTPTGHDGAPGSDCERVPEREPDIERCLGYEVVLRSFRGDWYDAADLYRSWGLRQRWAVPLTRRRDVPRWLLDSPPHVTIRLQGYVDDGPAPAIAEFLPYVKCVPLLERLADRVESPLVAVLMSWERGGPWVYPDCFPPVGGDESMKHFVSMARERGWHVGSFCNGTRWVTHHRFNGYDGTGYFRECRGDQGVCRRHDGEMWAEGWDQGWRPSFISCMGQEQTRAISLDFIRRLIGWGMESLQFFDQNCNAATFPCYAVDHGHPSLPGPWMAGAMATLVASFREAAEEAGEREVIQSTENPCNETCLPFFQQCDVRSSAPTSGQAEFVPVYHYLYHECIVMHGMMNVGPEPFALPIRNALNGVLGEIPGAVMTGDGTLLNRETFNWAAWEPKVGDDGDSLAMIRTVTAMRRGAGRDFLVYGRMERPAGVTSIDVIEWEHARRVHAVPSVLHAAWRAPDGRHGVILANWTTRGRSVLVVDPRLGPNVTVHTVERRIESAPARAGDEGIEAIVPPLGCVLIEGSNENEKGVDAQAR